MAGWISRSTMQGTASGAQSGDIETTDWSVSFRSILPYRPIPLHEGCDSSYGQAR
jgi:hypothetical protein